MIVEDMRNTGVLGRAEEYFIPWTPDQPDQNWDQRLKGLKKAGTGENGVFAVKVMANQLRRADLCLAQRQSINLVDVNKDGVFPHFHHTFKGAHFIWLKRNDILRQAISRLMALQTGINHATGQEQDKHFAGNLLKGYQQGYNEKTVYNKARLNQLTNDIVRENMIWQRFFRDWNISPTVFYYEEITGDFPGYLQKIAQTVNVELPADLNERKMVKLSNKRNEEWFDQFTNDLIEALPASNKQI